MIDSLFEMLANNQDGRAEEKYENFFRGEQLLPQEAYLFDDRNERFNAMIASRLRMGKEAERLTDDIFSRALEKMSDFIYAMEDAFNLEEEKIDYETIIEDSIVVKFSSHPKMRLNIYFDDESIGEDNPEESYLLYEKQGRMTLVNDTIRNNVDLIRSLLAL